MKILKKNSLQKNGAVNKGTPSKFLSLLLLILTSLVCSGINPAMANQTNNLFNEQKANKQISNCNLRSKDQILIFVSFSMPDAALQSYYQETQTLGGKLIIRGLKNNSFKDTQAKTMKLGINFDIDPALFEKYGVVVVPTIVLISNSNKQNNEQPTNQLQSCNQEYTKDRQPQQTSFIAKKITGHIPLEKAIEIMEKGI